MKKISLLLLLVMIMLASSAQVETKEKDQARTKMDLFVSKAGVLIKFVDYNLKDLKSSYESANIRVRRLKSGPAFSYFFQIDKPGKYFNSVASIEYADLLEVIKALTSLKNELSADIALNPDYLENKFMTVDGFIIGYFVSKAKATWYLQLEKYGSDKTLYFSDVEKIETTMMEAKAKIEELKK